MKVSRVVLIVVALHVLVIGGIFVFEGCSRAKAPQVTDNEPQPGDESPTNAAALPAPQSPEAQAQAMTPAAPATPAVAAPTPAPTTEARTYVVKKGDTLSKIARSQNVKIGDLARANNLTKTSLLKIGQKLQIPASSKTESTDMATASAGSTAVAPRARPPVSIRPVQCTLSNRVIRCGRLRTPRM